VNILVAPQAFKGSLDATEVAQAIARGVRQVFPKAEIKVLPVADGGEGTVRAMVQASGGHTVTTRVVGPLERPVNATWGVLGGGRSRRNRDGRRLRIAADQAGPAEPNADHDVRDGRTHSARARPRHAAIDRRYRRQRHE